MNKKQLEAFTDEFSAVLNELCFKFKKLTEKQLEAAIATLREYWLRAEAEKFKTIDTIVSDLAVKFKQKYPNIWPIVRLVFIKHGITVK